MNPHLPSPGLITRALVVGLARRWIGTPYHHQASRLGAGVDCIGLVRGVFRDLYGQEPGALPGYSRDWAEATGVETLLTAARAHLVAVEPLAARPGDVLVFRYRPRLVAKHAAILTAPDAMVHALEGAAVAEVSLSPWWQRRLAGAFSFPGMID